MATKHNYLRAACFERPDTIPMLFDINPSCWNHYPQEALLDLMEGHRLLFPSFVRPSGEYRPVYHPVARKGRPYRDDFGCWWSTSEDGITGVVTKHPLSDWESLKSYTPPDPEACMGIGPIDWKAETGRMAEIRKRDGMVHSGLRHGHTFLQLCDLRGYENLMADMADGEPRLWALIEMVEHFNARIVANYAAMNVEVMGYADDLGMQCGPMISPQHFRRYIKPSYKRLIKIAADKGIAIHMHSDGDIKTLADDLTDSGVQILNLQDRVNGIDWIAAKYRGKLCVDLDIDRQSVTPRGSPAQIDALVREGVEKISTPLGGLIMTYGLYPGLPLENVKAVMDAMERYAYYHN